MNKEILPLGAIEANCIVLWDDPSAAWIVDPGADAARLTAFLAEKGLSPALVALTHAHFDHIGAITDLVAKWPTLPVHLAPWAPYYSPTARPTTLALDLVEGATISAGRLTARVLATPGHTPGGICLHFEKEHLLLTGDTLFAGSCGRTDFPGGSMTTLSKSLKRLAALPPETEVIPGHGGTTTIARELATNPFLKG